MALRMRRSQLLLLLVSLPFAGTACKNSRGKARSAPSAAIMEGRWATNCVPSGNLFSYSEVALRGDKVTISAKYFSDKECKIGAPPEKLTPAQANAKPLTGTYRKGKLIKDKIYEVDTDIAGEKLYRLVLIEKTKLTFTETCSQAQFQAKTCSEVIGFDAAHRSTKNFKANESLTFVAYK